MVSRPNRVQPEAPEEFTKIKVMLVGDCLTGKTAFCKAAAGDEFPVDSKPTVGSDFYMRKMKTMSGQFQFSLWDMSGDSTFLEVRNEFYKES